jgi:hypothetical protein
MRHLLGCALSAFVMNILITTSPNGLHKVITETDEGFGPKNASRLGKGLSSESVVKQCGPSASSHRKSFDATGGYWYKNSTITQAIRKDDNAQLARQQQRETNSAQGKKENSGQ